MNDILLYSNDCPRCRVLKKKLEDAGLTFRVETGIDRMLKLGITTVPMLSIDGKLLDFTESVKWVNKQGV